MQSAHSNWWETPVYLVGWLVSSLLCILDAVLLRNALLSYMIWNLARTMNAASGQVTGPSQFQLSSSVETVDKVALLVLLCIAIAVIIWIENYIRKGIKLGVLFKRLGIVVGIEVVIIAVAVVLPSIFTRIK